MPVQDTRVVVLFYIKESFPIKLKNFSPLSHRFTSATSPHTLCISAHWKKKICWAEHGCLLGCRNGDLPPVVLLSVLPACCMPTERSGGSHTPSLCLVGVSTAVGVGCLPADVHGRSHTSGHPSVLLGSLRLTEGGVLYCICRHSRLNQRWSSVAALELIVYKAAERSLLNFIF